MMRLPVIILFLFSVFWAYGQDESFKLQGTITNEDGQPLPYATIYIKETGTGAVTNNTGHYEVNLKPGEYHLVFQFMGYQSVEKKVEIVDKGLSLNTTLNAQVMVLRDVVISGKDEDPAYAIIRKAVAKAKYHKNQVDSFSANVYIKGKGRLIKAPFYLRRRLKKEGIDSTKIFLSETYSKLQYKRPDIVNEKVLSVRTIGPQEATPPMEFITGNAYDPMIGDVVSPLSPKAFAYYRYEYLGTFKDKNYEISKIRVIPRVKDEYVVEGVINFVEDYFSIHSIDIRLVKSGINIDIQQIYEPVLENVWMPVSHKFFIHGKFMGFRFEYTYLASVSDYHVIINPDLPDEFAVIDEKTELIEEKPAASAEEPVKKMPPARKNVQKIQERMEEGEEVTTEELTHVLKTYEKEERSQREEPFLMFKKDLSIDTLAYTRDSAYWNEIRHIPLNQEEVEGYAWLDSLAEVNNLRSMGDTITSKDKKAFKPLHLITGARYRVGEKAYLGINTIGAEFNTVEGFNLETGLYLTKTFRKMQWLKISPVVRYGFSGKQVYSYLDAEYSFGPRFKRTSFKASGGRYISQFNSAEPIFPTINTITSLFFEENYMKLYEKRYVSLEISKHVREDLRVSVGGEYSRRIQLFNNTSYRFIGRENGQYEPNAPVNVELPNTNFAPHEALIVDASMQYKPGVKFVARNDQVFELPTARTPLYQLSYRGGLDGVAGSAGFHHIDLSGENRFRVMRNSIDAKLVTGTFLGDAPLYFMDFNHFMGNRTVFAPGKGLGRFRLLDYYQYSTSGEYISGFLQYNPSKLLLSQFQKVRLSGLREYLFANYLYTSDLNNYMEAGVAFDNIFRIFKVEAVASFINGSYHDFGVRVGLASFIRFDGNSISFEF